MSERTLRRQIVRVGRSLHQRGLTHGAAGNISVRLDDGGWLVTPTNMSLGQLEPDALTRLDEAGQVVSGGAPTKEMELHRGFYEASPATGAIVHLHSTYSVALSLLPDTNPDNMLLALTPYSLMRVGRALLVPYFRPGDPQAGAAIRSFAARSSSLVLASHGPLIGGRDLDAATMAVEELEETARLQLLTRGMNPRCLSEAQIAELAEAFGFDPKLASDQQ